jgi:hypothetical protein
MSGTALGITNLAHGEAPPEERVGGVGDLDLGHTIFRWVLDGGSKLWARLTKSVIRGWNNTSPWTKPSYGIG